MMSDRKATDTLLRRFHWLFDKVREYEVEQGRWAQIYRMEMAAIRRAIHLMGTAEDALPAMPEPAKGIEPPHTIRLKGARR